MPEHHTGQQDSQALPRRHDDGESHGPKLRYRVKDKELSERRADGEDDDVEHEQRVAQHEGQALSVAALFDQRRRRKDHRKEIHADHHLDGRHLVTFEELSLPVRGEGVEHEVPEQNDDAGRRRHGPLVAHGVLTRQQEHAESGRDHERSHVLVRLELLLRHQLAHQHHGDDLGRLGHHLGRKADELQGFILAPAAHYVGEGAVRVFVERRGVFGLLRTQQHGHPGDEGEDTVHEHEKLRVFESLARYPLNGAVLNGHDALLQQAPREVGEQQPRGAEDQFHGALHPRCARRLGRRRGAALLQTRLLRLLVRDAQSQDVRDASWTCRRRNPLNLESCNQFSSIYSKLY